MKNLPDNITELLKGVNDNPDDENKGFVIAATFNLYCEALRRCHGRVILHGGDVKAILDIAYLMIVQPPEYDRRFEPSATARNLTSVEQDQVLEAVTHPNDRGS